MRSFGEVIHHVRKTRNLSLKTVSNGTSIDPALLSKIENGLRRASREQVEKLALFFGVDRNELLVTWLSDRLADQLQDEDSALDALRVAEQKVRYHKPGRWERGTLIIHLKKFFQKDRRVKRAWLFGSYARGTEQSGSDLDLMVSYSSEASGTLLDYADLTSKLENLLHIKVDLVEEGHVKPFAKERVDNEKILIYG